ncbi:hypothetical protein [Cupriavidus sp. AU9028]|uniref:hypothetical protein n=1 Tax=Cupriavidus sp. AU9028 TaxID=2871157 RepID=UPI001C943221|nr:hypothetical protein [Cupriavidus sp. AU9028]MBY4895686.1 hypothetical protein [Cupriavidus sp. AU9028]
MQGDDWRVEVYRDLDVHVRVSTADDGAGQRWVWEVRIAQEGMDAADAGDIEMLTSGEQSFPTRHAAEVAAFAAGYAQVDRMLGTEAP